MVDQNTTPEQLRALARGALAQMDFTTASLLLRQLVAKDPRDANAWRDLANIMVHLSNPEDAVRSMRRAISIEPKNTQFIREYAEFLGSTGRYTQALAQHRRAITLGAQSPAVSWVEIGRIHERMHKIDLAREAAAKAIAEDHTLYTAHELLGSLAVREKNLDEAEGHYQRALEHAESPEDKALVGHSLARVHERRKQWDDAFEAYRKSNLTLSTTVAARDALGRTLPDYYDEFASERATGFYARWADRDAPDDLPTPTFLVGFPRSGTTMTEQLIGALTGVVTTDEHPFFTPVNDRLRVMIARQDPAPKTHLEKLDALTPAQISILRNIYWSAVWKVVPPDARERGDRVLDKHPLRLLDLGLINLLFPRAKVLVMLRDPRDCCLSCFFQKLGITPVSVRFLTLENLGEIYTRIMGFWVGLRDKTNLDWLEMRYEDLVSDFEPNARAIVDHIGEPWDPCVLEFHKQAKTRAVSTPSYEAVTQKVNTRAVGKWVNYEKHIDPLVERVAPFLDTFGYER